MRALAGFDWERMQLVMHWPLREALLAFENLLEKEAAAVYAQDVNVWALLEPHRKKKTKPPKLPKILRKNDG